MRSRVREAMRQSGSGKMKKEKIKLRQEMIMRRMRESEWRLTWEKVDHTLRPRPHREKKRGRRRTERNAKAEMGRLRKGRGREGETGRTGVGRGQRERRRQRR